VRLSVATLVVVATALSIATTARAADPQPSDKGGLIGDGYFFDINGYRRPFRPAQAAWFSEYEPKPDYTRAALEIAILLGLQTISYWARPAANSFDWDDPEFTNRLNLTAVRFDNNLAFTNFFLHPLSGALSYWFARMNDVSVPLSELYAIAGSIIWEFALEWREEVSINDLIVTPAGGVPAGAFAAALSDYLNSTPDKETVPKQTAEAVLGFPRLMHPWRVDPNSGHGRLPPDNLGFSSAFWHRFRIGFESSAVSVENRKDQLNGLQVDGELVSMVGFLRPGRFHKIFAHDNFTEAHFRIGFTPRGYTDVEFRTSATIVGWYSQNFRSVRHGIAGYGVMVGLPYGLRYVERTYAQSHDMFGNVNLFGVSSGVWLGFGGLRLRVLADVHYDFGAARALSFPQYKLEHPRQELKSVLEVQGYDYGIGPSGRIRGEVTIDGVTFGGYADYGFLRMIGGLDRWEEQNPFETNGHDTIFEYGTWLRYEPSQIPLYVMGALDFTARKSTLGEITTDRFDRRMGASVGLSF
jgi:hypothetical protein